MIKPERYGPYTIDHNGFSYTWCHDDYDGSPYETGGPPADRRGGYGTSVKDCKDQIDELEDELAAASPTNINYCHECGEPLVTDRERNSRTCTGCIREYREQEG